MNYFEMKLNAVSENEKFARNTVAAFAVQLNPTLEEIDDIKTVISEIITNCVVHGYNGEGIGDIYIVAKVYGDKLEVEIKDNGCGIEDIEQALTPFYTTKPDDERSGMGFTLIQSFVDELNVTSELGKGTCVRFTKTIGAEVVDA